VTRAALAAFLVPGLAGLCLAQAPKPTPSPKKETPSYTGDDLDRIAGRKPGEAPAKPKAPQPAPVPEATPNPNGVDENALPDIPIRHVDENAPAGSVDLPGASWADRAQAMHDAVEQAETRVKDLDSQAQALLWQYLQSTDTYEILRLKAEQQEILDQIPDAKKAVEEAQKALADFEKEAALAGVPPGEIRSKKTP
jgi:hypothetical protein